MSEFKSSSFRNEDNSGAPDIVGVTSFTSPFYFVPPSGTTAQRPSGDGIAPGMLRFNTDIGRLEVWRGDHWATILGESPNLNGGARGLFGNGNTPTITATMEYITISTLGNALTFGNTADARDAAAALSSSTRGVISGGFLSPATTDNIRYITISSTGNTTTFGTLTSTRNAHSGCASATRGLWGGGSPVQNTIEYVTISSTGNAVDFGDLTQSRYYLTSCASSTRGVFAGGYTPTPAGTSFNIIDYVTISTTGNASDFGDLTRSNHSVCGLSNSTKGLFAGGSPGTSNVIDFITIATTGNASDFGDATVNKAGCGGASSATRGVWAGGSPVINVIDYVTILSTGNALDFGDLIIARATNWGLSNAHGGL